MLVMLLAIYGNKFHIWIAGRFSMNHAHKEFRTEPHSCFALVAAHARFIAQLLLARLLGL